MLGGACQVMDNRINCRRAAKALLLGAAALATPPAVADDLRDALASAYRTNPTLQGARAQQRAVDEGVPIARAQGLPSLGGTANYSETLKASENNRILGTLVGPDRVLDLAATASYPVFSGGAVRNAINAAETRVRAGQSDLRGVETGVFAQTTAAYMDVIQNEAIVGLNRNNVQVLEVNLKATHDRYEIGDLTRTDVAQSEARLAQARSDLRAAEANLAGARETYIRFVGKPATDLQPPPPLPNMPATAEDAVSVALDNNPDLRAEHERSRAARFDSKAAGAGRLPKVSVFVSADRTDYLGSYTAGFVPLVTDRPLTAQAGVRATIPLFQGGLPAAQQRQAQAREGFQLETEIATEREVIATVRTYYQQWQAAQSIIVSSQSAVDAAALGLEGVRAENSVGTRTILDILNAEQELLNAQTVLVRARRNAYVAGFNLIAAMGRATAGDLGLDAGPLYDPQVNYKRVRGMIFDWEHDPRPIAHSTRTVDTPAQTGTISDAAAEALRPAGMQTMSGQTTSGGK